MAKPFILKNLMAELGLKSYKFEQEIGASNGAVSKILDSENDISNNLIEKILKKYPNVNKEWLLTGKEPMFLEVNTGQITSNSPMRDAFDLGAYNDDDPTEIHRGKEFIDLGNGHYLLYVPLITNIATMGYLSGYSDPEWLEELPKHGITVDHIPRGIYRTFVGRGESMDDGTKRSISNKDKVTGRVIDKQFWKSKLHLHKYQVYIIVHKDGITIKEISHHDVENGIITLHSWNTDKNKYPDRDVDLRDVLQLLNVVKVERDF